MRDRDGERIDLRDVLTDEELHVYAAQHGGPTWPLTAGTCTRCQRGGIRLDQYLCWDCSRVLHDAMGGAA